MDGYLLYPGSRFCGGLCLEPYVDVAIDYLTILHMHVTDNQNAVCYVLCLEFFEYFIRDGVRGQGTVFRQRADFVNILSDKAFSLQDFYCGARNQAGQNYGITQVVDLPSANEKFSSEER